MDPRPEEAVDTRPEEQIRDRALWFVRVATASAVTVAVGLTWLFSNAAEAYFSGRPAASVVPKVPVEPTPVQSPRPVVTKIVHGPAPPGQAPVYSGGTTAPRPPACVSTPSHPC